MEKKYEVTIDGQVYQVTLKEITEVNETTTAAPMKQEKKQTSGKTPVSAPMAGTILTINVKIGEAVKKGDTLCILEAMKMETQVIAPTDGVVSSIEISENQSVESNQLLLAI